MAAEHTYENVPVHVNKSADGELYVVAVETDGALHPIASFKAGGFDKRVAAAVAKAEEEAAQAEADAAKK